MPEQDETAEDLKDFPLRVLINEKTAKGRFGYEFLRNGTNDIVFLDTKGQSLSYEIETWNTAGDSTFWVKVPSMRNGTEIIMCWGLRDGCKKPAGNEPTDVWSNYVGVWHMDEEVDEAGATAQAQAVDASAHGHNLVPRVGPEGVYYTQTSTTGVFGNARINDTAKRNKKQGSYFEMADTEDLTLDGVFSLSFWVKFDAYANYPHLAARRSSAMGNVGFQIDLNISDRKQLVARGDTQKGGYNTIVDTEFKELGFTHLAFVYDNTNVSIYANGVCKVDKMAIGKASDNGLPIVIGNKCDGKEQSVWGKYDEIRLIKGAKSAEWIAAEYAQTNLNFYASGDLTNDTSAVLQNGWEREPSITQTTWEPGTFPTWDDFDIAPLHGTNVTVVICNRSTGVAVTNEIPTAPGAYRVVISVAESGSSEDGIWGSLEYTLGYRIVERGGSHEFAVNVARILLGNNDYTVEGGEVDWQGYDDEYYAADLPYWRHLDSEGNDASTSYAEYWSDSYDFNLGGGTHHIYRYGSGIDRLWDLRDSRIGNTFNNGDDIRERTGRDEEYDEGLAADQNYLPWNPESQRVLSQSGRPVDGYHRHVSHIVMQNTTNATVTSTCYTNGIGTIYFDAVNGWTDNVTNATGGANYRLVVEIATNSTEDASLPPKEEYISSADAGEGVEVADRAVEPFYKANWVRWKGLRVLRFDGDECEDLGTMDAVDLKIEDGGSYQCFYRVIVPVNLMPKTGGIRFRIRRETIDPTQSLYPDGTAYILLDNIICSEPTGCVQLSPYGKYFPGKARKNNDIVQGWEGAFVPAYPSMTDTEVFGRAKATMPDGTETPEGIITAATMHYRWHYLEQQTTGWKQADLDPTTLVTREPLELPSFQGDIDFWFDGLQDGHYYVYADYSGTELGLGNSGYSEEVPAVTNRADGVDWFVRTREGKSDYSEIKLLVKESESGAVSEAALSVVQDGLWRGFYRMTNAYDSIWWRIEPRNKQTDGDRNWNWSTNRWYVMDWTDTPPTFPAAGRMSEGTTNSWSRVSCDMQTGYLMFQVDETSLGVTIIHSDYQAFDKWNDAGKGYFTGSSTEANGRVGTSSDVREYTLDYGTWADTLATNRDWRLNFDGEIGKAPYGSGYTTFAEFKNYFAAWQIGKGMWVYGKYREPASHVALQMAGCGEGYAEFSNQTQIGDNWPRGLESVSFHARIAQEISPEYMAYNFVGVSQTNKTYGYSYIMPSALLTNYTVMARTCFDMKENLGFAGNAALSIFAYYVPGVGAYEARWEQVKGDIVTENSHYPTEVNNPHPKGQRLVIVRWNADGGRYKHTELIATTNVGVWNVNMPLMSGSVTNNLMPFCMSVYQTEMGGPTYVTAAVRITKGKGDNPGYGVTADANIADTDANWYFVTFKDESSSRLQNGGMYGVLSSNCEGMFVRPQFRAQPTWPSEKSDPKSVVTKNNYGAQQAKTLDTKVAYADSYQEIAARWWSVNPGRMASFYTPKKAGVSDYDKNYGFAFVRPDQTVDILAKPLGSTAAWSTDNVIGRVKISDFGQPRTAADRKPVFYYTSDSYLRLQTGGTLDDYRTDVVIHDIEIRQWRGYDSSKSTSQSTREDHTNFVFTCGWITNGAAQLSAKRTAVGTPCSIRSPLLDGDYGLGVGLGGFRFSYREPQKNIRLLVQMATNVINGSTGLKSLTYSIEEGSGNQSWHTVTNLSYSDLWPSAPERGDTRTWSQSFGYHGAKGLMRVIVDPALVEEVSDSSWTNTAEFGAIDITAVKCFDEPALDKGCWWGWNIQTVGDAQDSQKRMYLPDGTWDLDFGQSLALNNSVTADINPAEDAENFRKHMPFLQSPTFTNAVIGQISFKARKYELSEYAPAAQIVVYGAAQNPDSLSDDKDWTYIAAFPITNTIYTTYTCKTDSQNFYALRLAVVDVEGTPPRPKQPEEKDANPQRVLLDEVSISEAVRAMLAFRNVGAFRSDLDKNVYVEGVTTSKEQPLCDENWGVQAEVFATMLGDEIDKSYTPRVKLHWYVGTEPWGYANWKSIREKTTGKNGKVIRDSAWLAQTDGSNYVYRSSYDAAPAAIMDAQSEPGTVVQYMLEVEYRTINSSTPGAKPTKALATNWLDTASWKVPDWYAPVNYNADPEYGAGKTFAAFNILDTVAPGWAWLNEANIFGTKSVTGANSDEQFQYVEVCVPIEADLTGWRIRMLEAGVYNDTVTTNWIAKFGSKYQEDQAAGTKKDNMGAKYNKVFRSLGNWVTKDKLKESEQYKNGTLDGVWQFSQLSSIFRNRNGVDYVAEVEIPFGIQLVRPTGIIESSIVIVGTNRWGKLPGYREYDPTNIVAKLNQNVPGSKFFYAAEDCRGTFRSASVTDGRGESSNVWTNDWACSPGYINTNWGGKVEQKIEPDHPTPHGDSIIVYASVDQSGGPIRQWVGGKGSVQTNTTEMIILKRGSARGTNIVYQVDPWYEIAPVTTNGVVMWYAPRVREHELTVGKGASNNVTVVARAQVDSDLRDRYGLTADNLFTPAVMSWLHGGTDAFGHPFVHNGEIGLAEYWDMSGACVTNLSLTQMYCLDMDPTVSNLIFQAGMTAYPYPVDPPVGEETAYTNVRMSVFMMISNKVESVYGRRAWSPYILRGLDPDFTSWDYKNGGVIAQSWTSETFKITGILANGSENASSYQDGGIALRWFVFHTNSFYQVDNPAGHDPYTADIEIIDPHSPSSPGAAVGWDQYIGTPVWYFWAIDMRLKPVAPEILRPENYYDVSP